MQFARDNQEEEDYKREFGVLTALVQKCDNSIEHLKELSDAADMPENEIKARKNIIMSFRVNLKDITKELHDISSLEKAPKNK